MLQIPPEEKIRETQKLCLGKAKRIFLKVSVGDEKDAKQDSDKKNRNKASCDDEDQGLIRFKAVDLYNEYPFLMLTMDLYKREITMKDRKLWKNSKKVFETLPTAKDWFNFKDSEEHRLCKYVKHIHSYQNMKNQDLDCI